MSLGDNIKKLRAQWNWTQAELSRQTGIKVGHISKLENNESDPKLSTLYKLMKAFECSSDELLMDKNYSPLSGTVKQCFQRVDKLENEDKIVLLHVLHKYCDAQKYQRTSVEIEIARNPNADPEYIKYMESREENDNKIRLEKYVEHDNNLKNKEI